MMRRKAAFLDRDGVINVDHAYVHRAEDFKLMPGVMTALELLQGDGYALVVVTNQSGIARGFYTEDDYARVTAHMRSLLAAQRIRLDGVYHCPHHPEGRIERYARSCECRKPGIGLIRKAQAELGLDLPRSLLAGDRLSDLQAGRAAGVGRCYLITQDPQAANLPADAAFSSLLACARAVCGPHALTPRKLP